MSRDFQRIDIAPVWGRLNDELIRLVDYVPDDKINWSPKAGLWNFRGILLHIPATRDSWLEHGIRDGITAPNVWQTVREKHEIKDALARTWDRTARFLSNGAMLDAEYETQDPGEPVDMKSGHWIAYHLLEHDIHHRADILHYLAMLDIKHPDVGTP
jgi:uncharacterized damage-inducible protein DinB